jgi:hypothetical protein
MKPKFPIFSDTPPSDDFEDSFSSHMSGCRRECACGRVHFDWINSYDWDEGEFESLQKLADERPEEYFGHEWSIGTMLIDGQEWVMGCPCNRGRKYEDWIIANEVSIVNYLKKRAKMLQAQVDRIKL